MALTGDLLNIKDLSDWLKEHPELQVLFKDNNDSQSILGMPIVNGQKNVIGVLIYVHVRILIWMLNSFGEFFMFFHIFIIINRRMEYILQIVISQFSRHLQYFVDS